MSPNICNWVRFGSHPQKRVIGGNAVTINYECSYRVFLRFGHPDPEGSGRVSRQDCIQMPSYHLKPKSAL